MERITENSSQFLESKPSEKVAPNQSLWEKFYSRFTPGEKKQFIRNQTYYMTKVIQRDLRRIRESFRKLRENER